MSNTLEAEPVLAFGLRNWSWPTVSVELEPVWRGDHAVLEERCTRLEGTGR